MKTAAGTDFEALVLSGASGATGAAAPAKYIGFTANSATPLSTDTTLAGEISSGTLSRAAATYAHTLGTSSYTLSVSLTSDQAITLNKAGVFNAASVGAGGTMFVETPLNSPATLAIGDNITYTEVINL